MRALVQRVTRASVRVGDELVGEIGLGVCVLVGVTHDDTPADAEKLAAKVAARERSQPESETETEAAK